MNDYANALSDRVDYVLLIFAYLVHSTLYKLVSTHSTLQFTIQCFVI